MLLFHRSWRLSNARLIQSDPRQAWPALPSFNGQHTDNKYGLLLWAALFRVFHDEPELYQGGTRDGHSEEKAKEEREGGGGRLGNSRREKEIAGVSAAGRQRASGELKVSRTKQRDKTRELIWCLPVNGRSLWCRPALTIGFILSLLLAATMARPGETAERRGRGGGGGLRETASGPHRHLDSAAMFFCHLIKQPRGRKRRRLPPRKGGSTREEDGGGGGGKPTERRAKEVEMTGGGATGWEGELSLLGGGVTTRRREREQAGGTTGKKRRGGWGKPRFLANEEVESKWRRGKGSNPILARAARSRPSLVSQMIARYRVPCVFTYGIRPFSRIIPVELRLILTTEISARWNNIGIHSLNFDAIYSSMEASWSNSPHRWSELNVRQNSSQSGSLLCIVNS